jgi:tetratricopeptide (TPR) repeat protein
MFAESISRRGRGAKIARLGVTLGLAVTLLSSCAYYNTFYLARKYYFKATDGAPYEVDRDGTTQRANYNKSADYSKKLLGVYPKSKYVADAWLLWARALIGTDDPLKAIAMLEEFETRFPKSNLRPDAQFFLGLAYDAARKHEQAVVHFDAFLRAKPKDELAPYAYYERAKALMSLESYADAATSAGEVLKRWPGHVLTDRVLRERAEARFQQHAYKEAREDFETIGSRATNDDDRLLYLLREVDCLEADRDYDEARKLLADARAHVPEPPPPLTSTGVPLTQGTPPTSTPTQPVQSYVATTPATERYGRLTLRMGGVELLAGRTQQAIGFYQDVLHDYPRTQLAAEAQYRIGYAYETGAEDFTRAAVEYAKVKEQTGTSQFSQQAQARLDNLDRIEKYRTASGADSSEKQAEASFLVAEHYLLNLDRPDRAIDQYRAIADSSSSPAVKARALNAEAWVLSRKLDRKASADSLFWVVVREFPQTEAQLAARDYLEAEGQKVPDNLIVPPPGLVGPSASALAEPDLTPPPANIPTLGSPSVTDPGGHFDAGAAPPALGAAGVGAAASYSAPYPGMSQPYRHAQLPDSVVRMMAARDSMLRAAALDTTAAGKAHVDSLQRAFAHADTLGRAAQMAAIQKGLPVAAGVTVAEGGGTAPNLMSGSEGAVRSPSTASVNAGLPAGAAALPAAMAVESGSAPRAAVYGPFMAPAADTTHTARADSTHGTPADTTGHHALAAGAAAAGAGAATHATTTSKATPASTPAAAKVPAVKPPPGPISSLWVRQTKAERDSVKHAKFESDSLKKAEQKEKKAEKEAKKHAKGVPAAPAAVLPAAAVTAKPDSVKADSTKVDSTKAGKH